MKPEIKELYKIEQKDLENTFRMMIQSFRDYPKLAGMFTDWDDRQAGIEMTVRYYGAFDFMYGNAYSLDENMTDVVMLMFSDEQDFSEERFEAAGYNTEEFRCAASRLSEENQRKWWAFFDELDRTEAALQIPEPYLYVDFLCVSDDLQGQGRGSRLIQTVCRYADEIGMPVMLFTNGKEDIRFYKKNGFRIVGVTRSETFGLENTYVMYFPESCEPWTAEETVDA